MIIDNLSQIQAVEISRGTYGTETSCFMDVTSLIFFSKIEGFLNVSQKSTYVSIPGGALYSVMFFMHRCKCGHHTDKEELRN